ncbi:MAG: shikimate dehydrogenase [Saprospiraceae bacterium]|nr:shikimate dehydrogenase [Saprospiraceae bacterium]
MKTRIFGLLGYPLSHSFSPSYFEQKFRNEGIYEAEYILLPFENLSEVRQRIENAGVQGFNVTIPYKTAIISYLDAISPECAEIGAVNTVKVKDNRWTGYNTDVIGFEQSLLEFLPNLTGVRALILGDGGAARAVKFVFRKLGIPYHTISRKKGFTGYDELNKSMIDYHPLIVNTTPLGMYPDVDGCPPIPYEYLDERHFLYDLIYNPEKTLFLTKGEARGAKIKNGLQMLQIQAESAWQIWNQ